MGQRHSLATPAAKAYQLNSARTTREMLPVRYRHVTRSEALEIVRKELVEGWNNYSTPYLCNIAKNRAHCGEIYWHLTEALLDDDVSLNGGGFTEPEDGLVVRNMAYCKSNDIAEVIDITDEVMLKMPPDYQKYYEHQNMYGSWLESMRRWIWLTTMIQHYKALGQ